MARLMTAVVARRPLRGATRGEECVFLARGYGTGMRDTYPLSPVLCIVICSGLCPDLVTRKKVVVTVVCCLGRAVE